MVGSHVVEASLNSRDYTRNRRGLQYLPESGITGLTPSSGNEMGGSVVLLTGTHLSATDAMACVFGTLSPIAASVSSDISATCVTPLHYPSNVPVGLLSRRVWHKRLEMTFFYGEAVAIDAILPDFGSEGGGTRVTIIGVDFGMHADALCQFDGVHVKSRSISPRAVTCLAPARHAGFATIQVAATMHSFQNTHTSAATFQYLRDPAAHLVFPNYAIAGGGTVIMVVGDNIRGHRTTCLFGSKVHTVARVISMSLATCEVPPFFNSHPRAITFDLAPKAINPGVTLTLSLLSPPSIASVSPSQGDGAGGTEIILK